MRKTIWQSMSSWGGWHYRAVKVDKNTVAIQKCHQPTQLRYKTVCKMTRDVFEKQAELEDLYNPYNDDPASLYRICGRLMPDYDT